MSPDVRTALETSRELLTALLDQEGARPRVRLSWCDTILETVSRVARVERALVAAESDPAAAPPEEIVRPMGRGRGRNHG